METGQGIFLGAAIAVLVIVIAVPIVAVYRENSDLTIRRGRFALWVLLFLIVAPTAANVVMEVLPHIAVYAVLGVIGGVITYLFYQRVVRRARDAGKGKRIAYIGVIPIVNLIVFVILMAVPTAVPDGVERTPED